ncbi:hypothetical protein QTI66_17525 [Variovorax sp. J22R133]|uniref:hypothetical protein n=1 Tax=Variovorax brevis TaxID=3053503 RepID=UPI002575D3E8|nr:hypothetical protein [Variovorax sp. J22R133]MDM0113959.1 hypothetical protein [Variovorax sp. J22R133]
MESIPIAVFWCIAVWTLFLPRQAMVYLFFASMPFGSFAAIPTEVTGGLTLTPTPIVAILLIVRQLGSLSGFAQALDTALKRSGLLLLFLFWLVAGIATMFMPRFFSGTVQIVPVRAGALSDTAPLVPTVQNISQFVYISISVLTVFTFARMLRAKSMRRHALMALCLGAALTVFTGGLDVASQYLPLQPVLELFRTASYALLTDVEVLDVKRVVGLMPEASSFGSLALAFLASLYFFRRAMAKGALRDRVVPLLMGVLLLMVWLSTSSAAFLGLGLFVAAATAEWCWRVLAAGRNPYLRRGITNEFWLGAVGICLFLLVILAVPRLFAPIQEMFDVMVLQKSTTDSFEERSMWTQVSLNALLATHGLGVGLGGTRASNFAVAMASNAGVIGATFYFLFVFQTLLIRKAARDDAQGQALLSAVRWSYLPAFFSSLMVGTTPDFGLFNAFFYGFAVAIASNALEATAQAPPATARRTNNALRHHPQQRLVIQRSAHADR